MLLVCQCFVQEGAGLAMADPPGDEEESSAKVNSAARLTDEVSTRSQEVLIVLLIPSSATIIRVVADMALPCCVSQPMLLSQLRTLF